MTDKEQTPMGKAVDSWWEAMKNMAESKRKLSEAFEGVYEVMGQPVVEKVEVNHDK